jgi:hypothetical protein
LADGDALGNECVLFLFCQRRRALKQIAHELLIPNSRDKEFFSGAIDIKAVVCPCCLDFPSA